MHGRPIEPSSVGQEERCTSAAASSPVTEAAREAPAGLPARGGSDFRTWLPTAMRRRGMLSNRDLSRATGVSDSVISRWLTAGTVPTVPQLRLLTAALDVDLLDLMVLAGHLTPEERWPDRGAVTDTEQLLRAAPLDDDLRRVVLTAWRSAQSLQALRGRTPRTPTDFARRRIGSSTDEGT